MSSLGVITRKIRAALELPGTSPIQLVNVVIAEDLTEPENNSQFDERVAIGVGFQAGVAAEFAQVQLFNPPNSGVLVVVQKIFIAPETAGSVVLLRFDTILPTPGTQSGFRDFRASGNPAATINVDRDAAQLGTIIAIYSAPTTGLFLDDEFWVLDPGNGLNIAAGIVDDNVRVTYQWKELALPNV